MKLVAFNTSDGEVEIHKWGCADAGRERLRKGYKGTTVRRHDQVEFGQTDWPTRYAFAYDYWDNGILEEYEAEHGEGSMDVMAEMNFQPCCDALPDGGPETAPEPAPKMSRGKSYALRARARAALWAGIENQLNDSMYAEPELHAMMVQQSERVAVMFGMRD